MHVYIAITNHMSGMHDLIEACMHAQARNVSFAYNSLLVKRVMKADNNTF